MRAVAGAVLGHGEAGAAGDLVEAPLDARVAPAEDDALLGLDGLDHALALAAVLEGDAQRRALLGLEVDVVGEPLLELGGLGDELPGPLAGDGEQNVAFDDGHGNLLQRMGCA